jgi:preprotein translocase subunit SecE
LDDNNQSNAPKNKRRFKNPETFRERALKATEESAKPAKTAKVKRPTGRLKAVFSPIVNAYGKLKTVKALKPLFVVLSLIGRVVYPKYIRSSIAELKKVTWPTFKQSRKLTYAVLIFAIVFGASVAVVDYGLSKIFRHLLLK